MRLSNRKKGTSYNWFPSGNSPFPTHAQGMILAHLITSGADFWFLEHVHGFLSVEEQTPPSELYAPTDQRGYPFLQASSRAVVARFAENIELCT